MYAVHLPPWRPRRCPLGNACLEWIPTHRSISQSKLPHKAVHNTPSIKSSLRRERRQSHARSHFPSGSFGSRSSCSQRRPSGVAGMQTPQEHGMATSCHVRNTVPPENRSGPLRHSASTKNPNQCFPVLTLRHCKDSTISINRLGLYNQATAYVSVPRIKH